MIKLFENFSNEKVTLIYHFDEKDNYNLSLVFIGNNLVFDTVDTTTLLITDLLDSLSIFFNYEDIHINNDTYDNLQDMIHEQPTLDEIKYMIEGNKMNIL